MELKQGSIWIDRYKGVGFNRTFMELKLKEARKYKIDISGFNRTFMELKHVRTILLATWGHCFNRTFMELKLFGARFTWNFSFVLIGPSWN